MSTRISLANASLFPHIVSMLNAGHTVKLLLRGNSMRPYLVHERDYALLSRVEQKTMANGQSVPDIKVGDVILAEVAPGHYVLHRLIGIEGNHITLLGDGNLNPEHCTLADVRGRADAFIRKGSGTQENVTSLKYKIYRAFWMHTRPLRRYMLGIHNILFSSAKDLNRITPSEVEINLFLSFLRLSLWDNVSATNNVTASAENNTIENTELDKAVDILTHNKIRWEVIWQLASQQTVRGLVANAIKRLPSELLPQGDNARPLKTIYPGLLVAHDRLNKTLHQVFDFLISREFHPVLLKGQGNASYYPQPLLRQCGDIDVYIGEADYMRAQECIIGLVGPKGIETSGHTNKHFDVKLDDISIEIHRYIDVLGNPIINKRFQKLTKQLVTPENYIYRNINNKEIPVLPLYYNVLFVFIHLWHHLISSGIGLRQLCDWVVLLHNAKGQIDTAQLEKDLKSIHLLKSWRIMAYIAVERLGLPSDEMPCYENLDLKKSETAFNMILDGGNFGFFRTVKPKEDKIHWIKGKSRSFVIHTIRTVRMLSFAPEEALNYYFETIRKAAIKIRDILFKS